MKMKRKTNGDALPFSLIASEILSRVPSKSDIGRCRCVCKEWNSFLSTPMFNRTHFQSNATIDDYKLLQCDSQPPVPFRTIALDETIPHDPHPWPYPAVSVLASLDGLVCLASRDYFHATFVLWNPLTRATKTLPSIPGFLYSGDPVGFYYDDSCNDYKLVCLIHSGLFSLEAYVYSHRLDSWREIEFPFASSDHMLGISSPATFYGQCVYFTLTFINESDRFDIYEAQSLSFIICFDIKTETFRKIQFPDALRDDKYYYYSGSSLVVLNGCLHLSVSYQLLKHWELWRMMDGTDDKWVKVAAFDGVEPQRICTASAGNWLAVLDQDDNSFKKMNIDDFTKHYRYFSSPGIEYRSSRVIYVETLVSPNL